MLAASGLDIVKSGFSFTLYEYSLLIVGFIGAFVVALFTVRFFLAFVQKNTFIPFGIYRIVLALVYWIFLLSHY
jgi:undecaprenyl-diphosphatase